MRATAGTWFGIIALAAANICGCGDGESGARFATFNAGLAVGSVDFAEQRLPLVGPAVAGLEADTVCLQEVWLEEQRNRVLADTNAVYPFSQLLVTVDEGGGMPSCTEAEIDPLQTCVETFCADTPPGELATCGLANCGDEFAALSGACQSCIAANLGQEIEAILAACVEGTGSSLAFGGANGLLLLSRHPLSEQDSLQFESTLVTRVVLHSTIEVEPVGRTHIFCTHLTANLEDVTYTGPFGSWGGENAQQIAELIDWINQKAAGQPIILMGDMNTGPATGDIEGEFPENFARFENASLSSAFLREDNPRCTFCGVNPLVGDTSNVIIDHIFLRDLPAGLRSRTSRIFTDEFEIQVGQETATTPISDHFGLLTEIQ